jgi:hypothetical protein
MLKASRNIFETFLLKKGNPLQKKGYNSINLKEGNIPKTILKKREI